MAKLPTPEENARLILKVLADHKARPGTGVIVNVFTAYAAKNLIPTEDITSGLGEAERLGWITGGPNNFVLLTESGFEAT